MFTNKLTGVISSPRKTVSIRGLDLELYHDVFSMAKRDGRRVADVVNSALELFIERVNKGNNESDANDVNMDTFILRNDGEITLSKQDVVGLEREVGPFRIENTGHIVFEKDIDREALKYIDSIIIHAGTVKVPRNLYPHFLMRSEIHGKVEKY